MTDSRRKGKATELRCAANFLLEDWDVASPMVDTGADLIVSKGKREYRVQCSGRFAGQTFDDYDPWEGHPAPHLMYLDNGTEWWVVPRREFLRVAGPPKRARDRQTGPYNWYRVTQKMARDHFGPFLREAGIRRLEAKLNSAR